MYKMMKDLKKRKKGFSLAELMIVILVIGILFTVFVPKVDFATNKAKETGVKSDFRSYQLALETVAREQSGYSKLTDAQAIAALNANLDSDLRIDPASKTIKALDPWGNPYTISFVKDGAVPADTSQAGSFDNIVITSFGKDNTVDTNTESGEDLDDYTLQVAYFYSPLSADAKGAGSDPAAATLFKKGEMGISTHTTGLSQNQ